MRRHGHHLSLSGNFCGACSHLQMQGFTAMIDIVNNITTRLTVCNHNITTPFPNSNDWGPRKLACKYKRNIMSNMLGSLVIHIGIYGYYLCHCTDTSTSKVMNTPLHQFHKETIVFIHSTWRSIELRAEDKRFSEMFYQIIPRPHTSEA